MKNRYAALDFLRGVSIFGMIFSAIIPSGVLPAWMYHIQNPPPTHELDTSVNGIGWVDMVFPVFIFCMGVAIPLSGWHKFEKGCTVLAYVKSAFARFLMLWLFSYLYIITCFSDVNGAWSQVFTLLGFCSIFLIYVAIDKSCRISIFGINLKNPVLFMRSLGVVAVAATILIGHFCFGEVVNVQRRGIIIFLLAFIYLFGSLIWCFTRNRLGVRLVIFAVIFLFANVTRVLDWPGITYANPDIRWWFNMEYIYFLLLLIPATVIGDRLHAGGKLPYKLMGAMAALLMFWGLAMIVIEGGITKVPCTISYCFVTCSISILLLVVCRYICSWFPNSIVVKVFSGSGQNPLMSYIAFGNLVVPLMNLTGFIQIYKMAYPSGYVVCGVLRAAVAVFFTMLLVKWASDKKIFWKA